MQVGAAPVAASGGWRSHYIQGAPERNILADLTTEDREFIKATTGVEITDDSGGGPDIAFELASERRMGLVEGAVGREWLTQLAAKYADSAPTERPFTNAWIAAAMKYLEVPGSDSVDSLLEVTA